jgi:hypothetical protein
MDDYGTLPDVDLRPQGVMIASVTAEIQAHGYSKRDVVHVNVDVVAGLEHNGGDLGVLLLIDGTRLPIVNAMEVWETMTMGLDGES